MSDRPVSNLKEKRVRGGHNFSCAIYQSAFQAVQYLVKYHWHDETELVYFNGGNYLLEINMEQYHITSPCLFFINAGEMHQISTLSTGNSACTSMVFDLNILRFDNIDAADLQILSPLLNGGLSFPRFIAEDNPAFPPLFQLFSSLVGITGVEPRPVQAVYCENFITQASGQLMAKAYLLQILAILSDLEMLSYTEPVYNKRVESIKAALAYIENHYQEKIYIHDLAALVGMNEQYFCRFFKKALDRSPMEYVNEYRIRKAIQLVEKTNMAITDICLEAGYNNLGNFLREFKKVTGTTPLRYRKNAENESTLSDIFSQKRS